MITKAILAVTILFIAPILLGFLYIRLNKYEESKSILLAIVVGYIIEFAICQLITVPMIFLEYSFTILFNTYMSIIAVLSLISIILNIKQIKEICIYNFKSIKAFPKLLTIVTIILIAFQVYGFVGYAHIDDDDAYYVATSLVTINTDSLYKYSPTTGSSEPGGDQDVYRYKLAPFPVFTSIISKTIDIHSTIVAHLIIPIVFVPIVYILYGLIANELFGKDKKNVFLFLMIMCILHLWGGSSIRSNFAFLLFRIWQGKSILANFIMPAILFFFIKAEKHSYKFGFCFILFLIILGGVLTTTMGIGLPPMMLVLLCFIYEIVKIDFKNLKNNNYKLHIMNLFKSLACCLPSLVYGILFILE